MYVYIYAALAWFNLYLFFDFLKKNTTLPAAGR